MTVGRNVATTEPVTGDLEGTAALTEVKVRRGSQFVRGQRAVGYLFILPTVVFFVLFVAWPLGHSIYLSFTKWAGFGQPRFVGFSNFEHMVHDSIFIRALVVTILFTLVTTILQTVFPLLLAVAVNAGWRRSGVIFRTIFFLPGIISFVVTGILWRLIFDPNQGLLNNLLGTSTQWLGQNSTVLPSIVVVSLWQSLGLYMLIFFAGLQGIDPGLYEAASLDGANAWQRLANITVPQLRTVTGVVVTLNILNGLKTFDVVYVLTQGGPNHASEVLGTYLYKLAFGSTAGGLPNLGYATAISMVILVLCIVAVIVQFRVTARGQRD